MMTMIVYFHLRNSLDLGMILCRMYCIAPAQDRAIGMSFQIKHQAELTAAQNIKATNSDRNEQLDYTWLTLEYLYGGMMLHHVRSCSILHFLLFHS